MCLINKDFPCFQYFSFFTVFIMCCGFNIFKPLGRHGILVDRICDAVCVHYVGQVRLGQVRLVGQYYSFSLFSLYGVVQALCRCMQHSRQELCTNSCYSLSMCLINKDFQCFSSSGYSLFSLYVVVWAQYKCMQHGRQELCTNSCFC